MSKIIGYARVSTRDQDLSLQIKELESAGCQAIFKEKVTGTKRDRPELMKMLALLSYGDTLVMTKLDRFARSAVDAITMIRELFARGVQIRILNMGMIENTEFGRMMLTILSAFAEFERDMIVERVTSGKAEARKRDDFVEGRPPVYKSGQKEQALELLEVHSYKEVERRTGMSKSTLIRLKRAAMKEELDGEIRDRRSS